MNETMEVLSHEKFIQGLRTIPKAFIISAEVKESGLRKFKNKWQKYMQKSERPLILHFKAARERKDSKDSEIIYYLNGDQKIESATFEEKLNSRRLREMLLHKFTTDNLVYYLRYASDRGMNSTNYHLIMTLAINYNCSLCVRMLNAYVPNFNVTDYLAKNSRSISERFNKELIYALFDVPFNFSIRLAAKSTFEPLRKCREILARAAESGNMDGIKFLLEMNYMDEHDWENNTATTLAWQNEHYDLFAYLIKQDFPYPDNFGEIVPVRQNPRNNKALMELSEHIRKIQNLHDEIRSKNFDRIEEFIEENRKLRYARDVDNIPAIVTAVYSKNVEIIALLNANGMMTYDNGAARSIVNHIYSFNDEEIVELQKLNLKYIHHPVEDFIVKLHHRSLIKFDPIDVDASTASREVLSAFIDLYKNELTSPIVEFAARSSNLQMIIDLSSRYTFKLNPVSYTSSGLTNEKENRVYIGAKDILDPKQRDTALGIMVHELMHYVMFLMYHNDAKPYSKNDFMVRKWFEMIEDIYKMDDRHEGQWMVKMFQKYEVEQHQSELIARAVDLPILYRMNATGMQQVRRSYRDLFEFYESKVLPDVKYRMWISGGGRVSASLTIIGASIAVFVACLRF